MSNALTKRLAALEKAMPELFLHPCAVFRWPDAGASQEEQAAIQAEVDAATLTTQHVFIIKRAGTEGTTP